MPLLTRKQQILGKLEAVSGTAETLAAADGKTRVWVGAAAELDAPKEKRDLARATLTNLGLLAGTKAMGINFRTEINTPDDIADDLEFLAFLKACALTVADVKCIAIGAITTGPIARNETITGGTSAGTGRVLVPAVTGDAFLYYAVLTGVLADAEVLTASGGATCTSSDDPADAGYRITPVSEGFETITAELQEDGFAHSARGAMGNMSFEIEASKQGFMDFAMMGAKHVIGTKAMTTSIDFNTEKPPVLQNATLKIGTYSPVFSKIAFDLGNNVVMRQNGNATGDSGFETARVTGRDPKLVITLEHVVAATYDFFANYLDSSTAALQFRLGSVVGKTFWFFADEAEFDSLGMEEIDGIRQLAVSSLLIGTIDREFEMLFI